MLMNMNITGGEPAIIISGGGSGGHIFPAVAIANAFKARHPQARILFVGAKGRMEMEKVPEAGYEIKGLPIAGLQRKLSIESIVKNLQLPYRVLRSRSMVRSIIRQFAPNVVVGVGGFASEPTLKVAARIGYPTLLQEQNSYAGLTNKTLARSASTICVAYDGMERFFPADKIVFTGNPVRADIEYATATHDEGCAACAALSGRQSRGTQHQPYGASEPLVLLRQSHPDYMADGQVDV